MYLGNFLKLFNKFQLILPGWKAGVAFTAALIFVEEAYQYKTHGTTSWDGHH